VRFAGRLVAGTILVLLVTVIVLVWTAEVSLRRHLESDFAAGLEWEARLVREALPPAREEWGGLIERFAAQNAHRITLIDRSGVVVDDSEVPAAQLATLENHGTRTEVAAALEGSTGRAARGSASVGRRLMYVAIPGGPGVVRVAADLEQVNQTVRRAQGSVILAALVALLIGTILAFVAGRAIARPLTELSSAASSIADGSPPRFPHSGIPDIEALVRALRQMHLQLTERFEALQREQNETELMVDSMAEGVIAADQRGRVLKANESAQRLLGYEPRSALPDLPQLFRSKAARVVVDAALGGKTVLGAELEMDGMVLVLSARPLEAGGIILVMQDLTEMRRLEAMRRDFVANVSHELKTPLTSISGYSETLLTDRTDPDTTQRFLHVILGNAQRMQRLVDSLLDLSRIESGRWQPRMEDVDLRPLIQGVFDDYHERSVGSRVTMAMDLGPDARTLIADEDAVRQIVLNLVDNALRYTPPGGKVTCRSRIEGEELALSVSDTGAGISREHLPRIFERFYRADPSRSREEGGTGLGLAIVKHLVEAHGGRVTAESTRGKGTTITACFPRRSGSDLPESGLP
jgi:two-component system phosphate regulon sensor histidine kinase PhoR